MPVRALDNSRRHGDVTRDKEVFDVEQGTDVFIPRRAKHRVENHQQEPLRIIEVQTGTYLGEDDIIRYEDDYGRTSDE